jgi:hypothetical protein
MQCKFLVALKLEVTHHFIERRAAGRTGGLKPPATFGATKAPKTFLINPYKVPAHGCICRSNIVGRKPSTVCRQGNEALSFRGGVMRDCSKNPSPARLEVAEDG